tara:strand:+ start:382 stop:1095 length:714 start_codon:yes stop_codon:yes gene_type:complete
VSIAPKDRKSQFAHFLKNSINEFEYRLSQVLEVCTDALRLFEIEKESTAGHGRELNYRFAAFSSLVQTMKDILPVLTGDPVRWSSLNDVRHIDFIKKSRNAITHDGKPIINMWVEGRFYVACDFVRIDGRDNIEIVEVPKEDVATICLEFTLDLSSILLRIIKPFKNNCEYIGPMYTAEFFNKAFEHQAIPEFAKKMNKDSPIKNSQLTDAMPLDDVCQKLKLLIIESRKQLKEVSN